MPGSLLSLTVNCFPQDLLVNLILKCESGGSQIINLLLDCVFMEKMDLVENEMKQSIQMNARDVLG